MVRWSGGLVVRTRWPLSGLCKCRMGTAWFLYDGTLLIELRMPGTHGALFLPTALGSSFSDHFALLSKSWKAQVDHLSFTFVQVWP